MGHRQMGFGRPTLQPCAWAEDGAIAHDSRFWIAPRKRYLQALLDYIMISPALTAHHPQWPYLAPDGRIRNAGRCRGFARLH